MPRQITTTLYTFPELTPEGQTAAIEWYRSHCAGYDAEAWAAEWRDSMNAAREAFYFKDATGAWPYREGWEVGGSSTAYWDIDTDPALPEDEDQREPVNLSGVRAWKWAKVNWEPLIAKECPWTGYSGDEAFLDPLREFLKRPHPMDTLESILESCAQSLIGAWEADIEYAYSDEAIRERLNDDIDGYEWNSKQGGKPV